MIVDQLKHWRRYRALAELAPAFEFLEQQVGQELGEGRIEIQGNRLFALPQQYAPRPAPGRQFEAHRRYADVQYVAQGAEMMGYAPTDSLQPATPYDPAKDIAFYQPPAVYTPVVVPAGSFAVFYPQDAHLPCCPVEGEAWVRKIVVKVALD